MNSRPSSTDKTPDWRHQADCRRRKGIDPDLWFPDGTTGKHAIQADEAKAFCRECPVAMTCALFAIARRQISDGVYGGLSYEQRLRISRKAAKKDMTDDQLVAEVRAEWLRDTRSPLVELFLDRTVQGDQGHVWWQGRAASVYTGGRTLTAAQLAFMVAHHRPPDGPVKATCGVPYCVAPEHLADSEMRWAANRLTAAA
ncbi:WhiB family transcriptional regulator [Streptomyces sp. NPDC048018]|uniref:WhiB family transcriptional regulator n=1 Tax=Streptomyces sp. NPDC048018 TaxID=3365499 RepID=UPI003720C1F6